MSFKVQINSDISLQQNTTHQKEECTLDIHNNLNFLSCFKSPLNSKEIQLVHPKGDQSWVFIGRTDVEAETLILWPRDAKSWFIWKDPDAGKDWGQEKGTTEDEMVGWHHRLDRHGFGWTPGVGDGQGGLACCGSWGCKELDTTERLNWTEGYYAKWKKLISEINTIVLIILQQNVFLKANLKDFFYIILLKWNFSYEKRLVVSTC